MHWCVKQGDILNEPADVLICSANVFLNLSGGVGGEILRRFGDSMQRELHKYLADRKLNFVQRGDVVATSPGGTAYKMVLHAVAVDGFYQSSRGVVGDVVERSLKLAAASGARRVALTALATGFGRMSIQDFSEGIRPLLMREFPPIEEVVIVVQNEAKCQELGLESQSSKDDMASS